MVFTPSVLNRDVLALNKTALKCRVGPGNFTPSLSQIRT